MVYCVDSDGTAGLNTAYEEKQYKTFRKALTLRISDGHNEKYNCMSLVLERVCRR